MRHPAQFVLHVAAIEPDVQISRIRLSDKTSRLCSRFSSCFEATLMWRRTERANLEKKPSMRLSQEPCLGVKVNSNRPAGRVASQVVVSREMCAE
jgi:hypothetical protein